MKKTALILTTVFLIQQVSFAQHAVLINEQRGEGIACSTKDYNIFQGYRAFWSYVIQRKPKGYPGYWALVPETYITGYTGTVCKNVVEKGYGEIKLKTKEEKRLLKKNKRNTNNEN